MSDPYEEIIEGESVLRFPPGARHEEICERLHAKVAAAMTADSPARLLTPRTMVELAPGTLIRPDLALVTIATKKLFLVAEVINSEDHHPDTVLKKQAYEESNITRLWMVDPRYNNVEIYHGSQYGMGLKKFLAGKERLTEALLPGLELAMEELFRG